MKDGDYPGTFIVIEGADGAGTTTQSERLAEELDATYTYEPAGNKIGEKVDEMISGEEHSAQTIAVGFAADRMVHLEEEIIPLLKQGKTVVCDRYYHSSLVYQPTAGADPDWVRKLNRHALRPDITFILDVSAEVGMKRVNGRGPDGNIFEEMSFQEEVIERYKELPQDLEEIIEMVDATKSREEVFNVILEKLDGSALP